MFCTHVGHVEVETHHSTIPDLGSGQNGPIEVPFWETRFEWEIIKMVDIIGRIGFEVCGKKNYQKERCVKFLCQKPHSMRWWKRRFPRWGYCGYWIRGMEIVLWWSCEPIWNGIGVLLITPDGSHVPLVIKLNFEATNNMAEYEACIARM